MVTAGANQAYTNVVCALLDEDDKCVLFTPYYFNHLMCIQVSCFCPNSWIIKSAAPRLSVCKFVALPLSFLPWHVL